MTQVTVVTAQQRRADAHVVLAVQRRQRAEADEVAALLEARALGSLTRWGLRRSTSMPRRGSG